MRFLGSQFEKPREGGRAGRGYGRGQFAWRARVASALLLLLVVSATASGRPLQNRREAAVKAGYLLNIPGYVTWPNEAFDKPGAPFVIGVLKGDPVVQHLKSRLAIEKGKLHYKGHPFEVRLFGNLDAFVPCQVLFLPKNVTVDARTACIRRLAEKNKNVLFIGQSRDLLDEGGVINFIPVGRNVRMEVSLPAARSEDLRISAKLLRIAERVIKVAPSPPNPIGAVQQGDRGAQNDSGEPEGLFQWIGSVFQTLGPRSPDARWTRSESAPENLHRTR